MCGQSLTVTSEPRSFHQGPKSLWGPSWYEVAEEWGEPWGELWRGTPQCSSGSSSQWKAPQMQIETHPHCSSHGAALCGSQELALTSHCLIVMFIYTSGPQLDKTPLEVNLGRDTDVGWAGGGWKDRLIHWSSLTSSGDHVETQTHGRQTPTERNTKVSTL